MFDSSFFAAPTELLLGAITGIVFGFLLQKSGVSRFETIVGQFLLRDHRVIKVMLTAIVVGGIGIYGMRDLGLIENLHVKNAQLYGNALGGLIFGVGMALLGYCPGTAVAAIGEGSRHAIIGVLGMVFGAGLFAQVYPWMKSALLQEADLGAATLASATGLSEWLFIAALAVLALVLFAALERHEKRARS